MKQLLPKLAARLHPYEAGARQLDVPRFENVVPSEDSCAITHAWFWPRLGAFFKEKDVIVAETGQFSCSLLRYILLTAAGTSSFGMLDVSLPDGAVFVSQILWGSIGWSVG